ncbi:unnamed protein product [Vitrella brassicaformis CCMP3155]|uniref:tRNA (guanine(26)-N(2))-dimethyltransferase n=1 Tax=Vitrella brassicaformis (strain CCMP3155) TaxID=1169540 RepID=A0A0G4H5X8_VITBC|nr:unnamed protein product [Vitrella brassicaformis CCMP3155]|eukprot:CEM39225.1 unnamed protein product [Vitrella brassicaformis CCMP3155]
MTDLEEPAASQDDPVGDEPSTYREGRVLIHAPSSKSGSPAAFMNPAMSFNRDLTVLVLHSFFSALNGTDDSSTGEDSSEGSAAGVPVRRWQGAPALLSSSNVTVLEPYAGTGLRSLRFAAEVPGIHHAVANDLCGSAVTSIRANMALNKESTAGRMSVTRSDAADSLWQWRRGERGGKGARVGCIDLDPFGSAAEVFPLAAESVCRDGLLCVTCTDIQALCGGGGGSKSTACWARYGGMPMATKPRKEGAIRLVLNALNRAAALHGRSILPLLSLSVDYYIRVYVQILEGGGGLVDSAINTGMVATCPSCRQFDVMPAASCRWGPKQWVLTPTTICGKEREDRCKCGAAKGDAARTLAGPMWIGPLHDKTFVRHLLSTLRDLKEQDQSAANGMPVLTNRAELEGLLTVINEECSLDEPCPFFYHLEDIAYNMAHFQPPLREMRAGLSRLGWSVSQSHTDPSTLKTSAPFSVLLDVALAWAVSKGPEVLRQIAQRAKSKWLRKEADEMLSNIELVGSRDLGALSVCSERPDGSSDFVNVSRGSSRAEFAVKSKHTHVRRWLQRAKRVGPGARPAKG